MSAVGKWVAGIVSAVLIAVLSAWAVGLMNGHHEADPTPSAPPPKSTRPHFHPSATVSAATPDATDPDVPTEIYLNRDSGAAGTVVLVSGQGFAPGEPVTLRFHTETVAHTTAGQQGSFDAVSAMVPRDWQFTGQFDFVATGERSIKSAEREFRVT